MLTFSGAISTLILALGPLLAGMNAAIVYRFWPEPWLITKLVAVTGLITFLLFSITFDSPPSWLVFFGFVVVLGDIWALGVISSALRSARAGDGILVAYRRR